MLLNHLKMPLRRRMAISFTCVLCLSEMVMCYACRKKISIYYIYILLFFLLLLLKYKELIDIFDTSLKDQIVSPKKTTYFRHTLCR